MFQLKMNDILHSQHMNNYEKQQKIEFLTSKYHEMQKRKQVLNRVINQKIDKKEETNLVVSNIRSKIKMLQD